jgi:cysteinyl-tRNA synthetase
LEQAASGVERLRNFLREHPPGEGGGGVHDSFVIARRDGFLDALADDFNTPRAMAEVFELVSEANKRNLPGASDAIVELLEIVGLGSLAGAEDGPDAEAERLLAEREQARGERDFERADRIRDQLSGRGWEVRDGPDGARLVRRG